MARRNHLDDFTRGRMIGKLEEGCTVTSVAAEFGINKSVVSRAWKAFQTTGEKRQSASVIVQQLSTAKGRQVLRFTVARRLHKGGLFARRPERCLPLKVDHRRHRLQCAESTKTGQLINGVVSSLRMRIGLVPEAILNAGSVTRDRYCEEVLLHVLLFRGAIGLDFIFMDDNARPHRTLAVEELLESEDITRMDWPAYSPDLNPIEHVWDALGRCIAACAYIIRRTPNKTQTNAD
ncbi:transposable element Tcb2 transposase [Trichonephila clavipes]|nr:transposable element Tcb2 transposase [Trichonephila clavipes]